MQDIDPMVEFERMVMNLYEYGGDWFWSDDELDYIGVMEYRIYEDECNGIQRREVLE